MTMSAMAPRLKEGSSPGLPVVTAPYPSSDFFGTTTVTCFSVVAPFIFSVEFPADSLRFEMVVLEAGRGSSVSSGCGLGCGGVFSLLLRRGDGVVAEEVALGRRWRNGRGITGSMRLRRAGFSAEERPAPTESLFGAMMSQTMEADGRTWGEAGQPCSVVEACAKFGSRQDSEVERGRWPLTGTRKSNNEWQSTLPLAVH